MNRLLLIVLLSITFQLGMSVKQAQARCPKPLIPVYKMLHVTTHFACDDGKKTTVLIFDEGRLSAIVDLKRFVKHGG